MQLPCFDAESLKAVVCIGPASTWCAIKKLLTHPASTLITSCLGLSLGLSALVLSVLCCCLIFNFTNLPLLKQRLIYVNNDCSWYSLRNRSVKQFVVFVTLGTAMLSCHLLAKIWYDDNFIQDAANAAVSPA